jgi:hypothetical protein
VQLHEVTAAQHFPDVPEQNQLPAQTRSQHLQLEATLASAVRQSQLCICACHWSELIVFKQIEQTAFLSLQQSLSLAVFK